MNPNIVIIDYGMGNLHSVQKKLSRLNAHVSVGSSPAEILRADKLILPGVGHFKMAMEHLQSLHLIEPLCEAVLEKQKPILGICLGMQLLADESEEGNAKGLGWIDGKVIRFKIKDKITHKVPHMGWNQVRISKPSLMMKDIPEGSEFYFVHSYHMSLAEESGDSLNVTEYEYPFVSAIEKNNIFGVQYHPEKSHSVGEHLLRNFVNL